MDSQLYFPGKHTYPFGSQLCLQVRNATAEEGDVFIGEIQVTVPCITTALENAMLPSRPFTVILLCFAGTCSYITGRRKSSNAVRHASTHDFFS